MRKVLGENLKNVPATIFVMQTLFVSQKSGITNAIYFACFVRLCVFVDIL